MNDIEIIDNLKITYGLGKVGELIPATGKRETAADRISTTKIEKLV